MTQALVKFTPIVILETKNGRFYFSEKSMQEVTAMMNSNEVQFLMLNGEGVSKYEIKRFYQDLYGISGLTKQQLGEYMRRREAFFANVGYEPSEETLARIISKIISR
jgi:hypothetical protein